MADFDWSGATDIIPSMAGLVPEPGERSIRLQCLPLASLVLAMGNPTVHYFSLDIEGAELQVQRNRSNIFCSVRSSRSGIFCLYLHLSGSDLKDVLSAPSQLRKRRSPLLRLVLEH